MPRPYWRSVAPTACQYWLGDPQWALEIQHDLGGAVLEKPRLTTCVSSENRTQWLSLSSWNIDGCAGMGCGVCAIPKAGKTMRRAEVGGACPWLVLGRKTSRACLRHVT